MDPSSPKRHQRARLEVSSTSQQGEGVHHEAYSRWSRFGEEREVGWLGTPEDLVDIHGRVPVCFADVYAIGEKSKMSGRRRSQIDPLLPVVQ